MQCGLHGGIQLSSSETRETTAYGAGSLSADAHLDHSHADSCLCSTASTQSSNFSQELRSTLQEPATTNMIPHEIPELSLQQSKADNCIWAYCCFRHRLEYQRVGCYPSPGMSLGRLFGSVYIFVCWLGSLFCSPFCTKTQTVELESCGRTDFTWEPKSTFVKFDGHSWTCLKNRKFFKVDTPYLPNNKEYKWVSYDFSEAGKYRW